MRLQTLVLFFLASTMAFCADITGKWTAQLQIENNTMQLVYDFKLEGTVLTGTVKSDRGEVKISEGKIEGSDISFTVLTDEFKALTKGTISGDEIKMKISVEDRTFELTAKRAS